MSVKNIRHAGLVVTDLEDSLNFYTQHFGFKVVKQETLKGNFIDTLLNEDNVELTYVKLATKENPGALLELYYFENRPDYCFFSPFTHIAVTVKDAKKIWKALEEDYQRTQSKPILDPEGKNLLFMCHDPSGNMVEVVQEMK